MIKNISKNVSGKYSQKLLDHAKKSATDALIYRVIQKTAEATGDTNGNKIADRIMRVQKIQNKIIKKQLQINLITKYLKKDKYLKKEYKKLLKI